MTTELFLINLFNSSIVTRNQAGANKAAFFSNAIDTESKGIDIVISHKAGGVNGLTLKH
jgi:hypothetical protein